jgi:hypothetical protein
MKQEHRMRESLLFGFLEEALRVLERWFGRTNGVHATNTAPRPKQRSLRQTPHTVCRHGWKRESRRCGFFLYGFEEKSPHVGERWFRRTGAKPRYGVLTEESVQKRTNGLPKVGKRPPKRVI